MPDAFSADSRNAAPRPNFFKDVPVAMHAVSRGLFGADWFLFHGQTLEEHNLL